MPGGPGTSPEQIDAYSLGGGELPRQIAHLAESVARASPRVRDVAIQLMDHVGVVVDDLEAAIAFFVELGMELDGGTTPVEGDWVDRVVGLDEVRVGDRIRTDARPLRPA